MNEHDASLKKLLRNKYSKFGFSALTEKEIVMLILTYTVSGDFEQIADNLLKVFRNYTAIADADAAMLANFEGVDQKTVVLMKIIPQLSRRFFLEQQSPSIINSTSAAKEYFQNYFIGAIEEKVAALCVNSKLKIIDVKTIITGNASAVNTSYRKIVEFALANKCSCIIISHNHPAGNPTPSASDYNATNNIYRTLKKFGITLVDHIVTAKNSAVSMRELPFSLPFKKEIIKGYSVDVQISDASDSTEK